MKPLVITVVLLSVTYVAFALKDHISSTDSAKQKSTFGAFRLTTRLHSSGFFNFSGRICSPNPAIDVNGTWEVRNYGISLISARDLYDNNSDNNFTFAMLYKRLNVRRFSFMPHVGLVMEGMAQRFGDRIFLISSCALSKKVTIDETTFFANLLKQHEQKEWLNRLRIVYHSSDHLQFTLSNWHNNAVFDGNAYLSAAFQTAYNRIKVGERNYLQTAVSYFLMTQNSEHIDSREKSGMIFTVGLTME